MTAQPTRTSIRSNLNRFGELLNGGRMGTASAGPARINNRTASARFA